jgi:uncharacterized membrane protein YgdD (TMEM256/DUF423 family)
MNKFFLQLAALLGAASVALGAFAAHGLKKLIAAESLQVFETGVRYQFYHVFALLAAGMLYSQFNQNLLKWSGRMFIAGILLFSGSLYCLAFFADTDTSLKWMGAITPFGGMAFIAGWLLLFTAIAQKKN